MKKFEFLDHTADLGVRIFGRTQAELFRHAGLALFEIISDPATISAKELRSFSLQRESVDELLVEWLSQLLYVHDTELLLFSRFRIQEITAEHLQADAWGEVFKEDKHIIKTGVKAITYHNLAVSTQKDGTWIATVVMDL